MDCGTFREGLSELLASNGTAEPASRQELLQHMAACAECRRLHEELASAMKSVETTPYDDPPAGYWESFPARVRARIEARRRQRALARWAGLAAAAALVLAVGVTLVLQGRRHETRADLFRAPLPPSLREAIPDTVSPDDLEAVLARYDGDDPPILHLADQIDADTAPLYEDDREDPEDYGSDESILGLVDGLDAAETRSVLKELQRELG